MTDTIGYDEAYVINNKITNSLIDGLVHQYAWYKSRDGREKSELYKVYEQVIGELGLKVLNTFLPDSKRFRRELTGEHKALFRSTLFPADGTLVKGSNLKEITEELLSIIKK